ncbi:M28 family metallopeptidase [Micromonospora polyrhachis]|uniref:N-acetylated-alpha-linked acidic dipeptidase n=1 Tax=Micromonospora polyrhachis TaxID=1282883 RepID=A0A7W7WRP7_9ACTN|nr:M28 family peptidase [Micromonospora polyrhachis]MBB4961325.1 N-acetylated-alpha-linked acidic dipeptidase [Micromonospora polyrhachis]
MKLTVLTAATLTLTLALPAGTGSNPPANPYRLADRLEQAVTGEQALRHLTAWQRAADTHGGNRASGTPGFAQSADYLVRTLRQAGYRVTRQAVPYQEHQVDIERAVRLDRDVPGPRVLLMRWSPTTPAAGIEAPVVLTPTIQDGLPDPTPGCEAADYAGLPVHGAIVVAPQTSCGFVAQQRVAVALGARAMLFYVRTVRPDNIYRAYLFDPAAISIPLANVSQRDAERLAADSAARTVRLRLELRAHTAEVVTENILAETEGGRPDRVVMAGAHLDSTTETPGINDNAAAAGALLETALQLAPRQRQIRNKVRFAWWGAEELIEVGSIHYLRQLTPEQRANITLYLNYELIASPNFGRFIVDGDDSDHPGTGSGPGPLGSGAVEAVLTGYYASRGLGYETADINSIGSDHWPFRDAGIPIGGLDGGTYQAKSPEQAARYGGLAGEMFDPCYHQPCDTVASINRAEFDRNCRAVAWVVGRFAVAVGDVVAQRNRIG